jgi:hypothetical protein
MRILKSLTLALLVIISSSCQKEISEDNLLLTGASGTLKTSNGNCLPSVIYGIYKEGTALGSSNYIDVEVEITSAGSYTIESQAVNGMKFLGTGEFTTTGLHTVRLNASGTPAADGTFPVTITFGNSVCTLSVLVVDAAAVSAAYTFDTGTSGECMGAVVSGVYKTGIPVSTANNVVLTVEVLTEGTYSITTAAANGLIFSGSGVFTTPGINIITLTATGVPVNEGNMNVSAVYDTTECVFSINVLPASTSTVAAFTLGGAGSDCTGTTLNGIYMAGFPVSASNTAVIDVNVTTPGTYIISSVNVNGITFSSTGVFATTGAQQVTLTASGTPVAAGVQNYSISGSTGMCNLSVTFEPTAPAAVFTLNGAPGNCNPITINGLFIADIPMTAANTVIIKANVTTAGLYNISTATANGITFSAAGIFAATGTGIDVILNATGIPDSAGTHSFTPMAGTAGCTFDIVTEP